MFRSSERTWSVVVMTRALAWNPRCASISRTNSSAMSTFEFSRTPETIVPAPAFAADCAVCHARESCTQCHRGSSSSLPAIQALPSDRRVADWLSGRASLFPQKKSEAAEAR